ncbi:MAG: hypothetical protein U0176_04060 [Bacteroidia bacterium]
MKRGSERKNDRGQQQDQDDFKHKKEHQSIATVRFEYPQIDQQDRVHGNGGEDQARQHELVPPVGIQLARSPVNPGFRAGIEKLEAV